MTWENFEQPILDISLKILNTGGEPLSPILTLTIILHYTEKSFFKIWTKIRPSIFEYKKYLLLSYGLLFKHN